MSVVVWEPHDYSYRAMIQFAGAVYDGRLAGLRSPCYYRLDAD